MTHTIAAVTFSKKVPGEDAPVTCSCGWTGMAGDFSTHRREVGAGEARSHGRRVPFRVKG